MSSSTLAQNMAGGAGVEPTEAAKRTGEVRPTAQAADRQVAPAAPEWLTKRQCTNCGATNSGWRWRCERCNTLLPGREGEVKPTLQDSEGGFWGSLGIGCGTMILANLATNGILLALGAAGMISDVATAACANVVLLAVIAGLLWSRASRSREEKGEVPLNPMGMAVAVGIYILIQVVAIPLLQSMS